jgi:thioredoxin reductase (NADPH)
MIIYIFNIIFLSYIKINSHFRNIMPYKTIIVGSGPAGYTAGIYAARNDLFPLMFTGPERGGQLITTKEVENYPGFPDGINGYELMNLMERQAIKHGTEIVHETVSHIDTKKYPFVVTTENQQYEAYSVIITTGATANKLNIPGSERLWMHGISACAVCDGALPIFRNKHIVVVGGGDTAMEEALFLSKYASHVTIVHRRDKFRASKVLQKRVLANEKISVVWNSEISSVDGDKKVESVSVKNNLTFKTDIIKCSGLFYAIGHTPNTNFLKDTDVKLDKEGYILVEPGTTKTSVNGIFAAGDVQDKKYRQAVTAAGSGCMAAMEVDKYLTRSYRSA